MVNVKTVNSLFIAKSPERTMISDTLFFFIRIYVIRISRLKFAKY